MKAEAGEGGRLCDGRSPTYEPARSTRAGPPGSPVVNVQKRTKARACALRFLLSRYWEVERQARPARGSRYRYAETVDNARLSP